MPGAAATTFTCAVLLAALFAVTTTFAVPTGVSYGIWKLIWFPPTYSRGAALPFTETETLPRVGGSGVADAPIALPERKFVPNIVASDPGATGAVKLAAFTMPPDEICGPALPAG